MTAGNRWIYVPQPGWHRPLNPSISRGKKKAKDFWENSKISHRENKIPVSCAAMPQKLFVNFYSCPWEAEWNKSMVSKGAFCHKNRKNETVEENQQTPGIWAGERQHQDHFCDHLSSQNSGIPNPCRASPTLTLHRSPRAHPEAKEGISSWEM